MPHKFNEGRRHKFERAKYSVTNWSEYNESLRRRGDITVWFDPETVGDWVAPRRKTRGGQKRYSDLAIEVCLTLRAVFRLALRQTQGLARSVVYLLDLKLPVPDFSTLSRRAATLNLPKKPQTSNSSITLIIDSTGLKIHAGGCWRDHKYQSQKPRKSWRKLHIAIDPDSGDILTSELTTEDAGDATTAPDLIANVDVQVGKVIADGAYDGQTVFDDLINAFGPDVEIIIPPPRNAILGLNEQRDGHIQAIAESGRLAWQKESGYNQRSKVEAQIGRWKQVIGTELRSRKFENQKTEAQIASRVLNRMTADGRAIFERVT